MERERSETSKWLHTNTNQYNDFKMKTYKSKTREGKYT